MESQTTIGPSSGPFPHPQGWEPTYFYANPWPFDANRLLDQPLSAGGRWHVGGWQGTILPYSELVGDAEASRRLRSYFEAVYRVASALLLA